MCTSTSGAALLHSSALNVYWTRHHNTPLSNAADKRGSHLERAVSEPAPSALSLSARRSVPRRKRRQYRPQAPAIGAVVEAPHRREDRWKARLKAHRKSRVRYRACFVLSWKLQFSTIGQPLDRGL